MTAERGTNTKSTLLGLCESAVSAMRTHAGPVALLLPANVARSEIGVNREIPASGIILNGCTSPKLWQCQASTCPWRIDTVGVKRSDPRSAQQPRTPAPDDLMGSLPKVDNTGAIESLRKITQPLVSDIRIDSAVAIETSGDLRLVVTQADSAFALRLRYGCDGC